MGTTNTTREDRSTRDVLRTPVDLTRPSRFDAAFRSMSLEQQYAELAPRGMDASTAQQAVSAAFGLTAPPTVGLLPVAEVIESEVMQQVTAAAEAATPGDGVVSHIGLAVASGWLAASLNAAMQNSANQGTAGQDAAAQHADGPQGNGGQQGNVLVSGELPDVNPTPGHDDPGPGPIEPAPPEVIVPPDPEPPVVPEPEAPTPEPTGPSPQEPSPDSDTDTDHDCPAGPTAAGEQARIWGDPHIVGADGGKFDFQGESGKKYNLLTDAGLTFHGKFKGANGLTVVKKTWLNVTGAGGSAELKVTPKKARLNGKNLEAGKAAALPDGGYVIRLGSDVIAHTAEGYKVTQHMKDSRLDAEIDSGASGVGSDGQLPTGLLGQTFDADDKARDGKKGKGAQGEGAIDGVFRDYEVRRGFDDDWYLATYPDVAAAVRKGKFANGRDHFDKHGKDEGRSEHWAGGASHEFDEVFYLRE